MPQAVRIRTRSGETFSRRESEEASAAPIWMMGPSRPSEPPVEMTAIEETTRADGRTHAHGTARERDGLDHLRDAVCPPLLHEPNEQQPADETAGGRQEHAQRGRKRLGAADDVGRLQEQLGQLHGQKPEDDRAQGSQHARQRRQQKELRVGVPPEEASEARPRGEGAARQARQARRYRRAPGRSCAGARNGHEGSIARCAQNGRLRRIIHTISKRTSS